MAQAKPKPKNTASFAHTHGCCLGELEGPDAEAVYGVSPVAVVQYGRWSWPSACWLMVPGADAL